MTSRNTDLLETALDRIVEEGLASEVQHLKMAGNRPPWTDTSMQVKREDQVTWLAAGRVRFPPGLPGNGEPGSHLWVRITPGDRVEKAASNTHTFRAAADGALEFGILLGEWKTPDGQFDTPLEAWSAVAGEIDLIVINWGRADPAAGLDRLADLSEADVRVSAERDRRAAPRERPTGWSPHWLLGEGGVFYRGTCDGHECMAAHTKDDVSIIRYEVDAPVGVDTTLRWRWRIDALPSSLPEDQLFQHDYVSIAAEFDCGRDLTWYWSSSLPVETWYTCPIPQWAPRETHCVVRTGRQGLGEWHSQQRRLAIDYRTALGAEPGRLVALWLIAVSLFQHGEGRGWFSDIAIEGGGQSIEIPTH